MTGEVRLLQMPVDVTAGRLVTLARGISREWGRWNPDCKGLDEEVGGGGDPGLQRDQLETVGGHRRLLYLSSISGE